MDLQDKRWTWDQMTDFFYMSNRKQKGVIFECKMKDILSKKENLEELFHSYGMGIKAKNNKVTAMYLAGWLGYMCGGLHFFESESLEIDQDNPTIQVFQKDNGHVWISFFTEGFSSVPSAKKDWAEEYYQAYLVPIYREMGRISQTNLLHLWYQAAHSLYWVKHRMQHSVLEPETTGNYIQTLDDFTRKTTSSFFGVKLHPYRKKLTFADNPWDLNDPLPIKPSCCLAYQIEGGHCCYSCPRLKREERLEIFERVVSKK